MYVKFATIVPGASRRSMEVKLNNIIEAKLPKITRSITLNLFKLKSIQKFISFMESAQFRADFGVDKNEATQIISNFRNAIKNEVNISVVKSARGWEIGALNEDILREATQAVWFSKVGGAKSVTQLINAWDIYENGILREIRGFKKYKPVGAPQKELSRSGLALMRPTTGAPFVFHYGIAPKIKAIHREVLSVAKRITSNLKEV